jgi:DNA repair protein RadA/Sms
MKQAWLAGGNLFRVAKQKEVFVCRSCGGVQSRWMGKCPDCGAWDSLDAERISKESTRDPQKGLAAAWSELGSGADGGGGVSAPVAAPITEIESSESAPRIATGIAELDRVLGGEIRGPKGLVPGSAILIGGSPGIGKSTLLLQAAASIASQDRRVLYVSSEESTQQVKLRSERLLASPADPEASAPSLRASAPSCLFLLSDTNLARIIEQTRKVMPAVLIIDSIQMIYKADLPAAPGSITQLRRCCAELVYLAKASGICIILVGHVTKEGTLAGPRLLEHLVDAVLSFEGDRYHAHRLVRSVKNRFGTTQELGIFEMTAGGLREVPEGAGVPALSVESGGPRPGSVVCPVVSGTRCVLVELQALTATGFPGATKRKASGIDPNRLAMLIAVLEQHAELRLADRDVFASSVGGVKVVEPASDLALLLAIAGAHFRRAAPAATAAAGEVGLGGEIRPVTQIEMRLREAARLGYRRVILPRIGAPKRWEGLELLHVRTVNEAIGALGR